MIAERVVVSFSNLKRFHSGMMVVNCLQTGPLAGR